MLNAPDLIPRLIALRTEYGPNSETGCTCSNLIEQLRNRSTSSDPKQIEALNYFIDASFSRLAAA